MSAIVVIHHLDDRPVDRMEIELMNATLSHRGPDGAGVWCEGTRALGHRMLWTTPESLEEKLPFVCRSGDLVITADPPSAPSLSTDSLSDRAMIL